MIKKDKFSSDAHGEKWRALFQEGASALGVQIRDRETELFELYLGQLQEWSQRINLTSIKTPKGIAVKHFLDSLTILKHLPDSGVVADLGSGAGFPGIPVKIARPLLELVLVESVRKKASFLRHIVRMLNLTGIEVYLGRVEDLFAIRKFDCVVSRAFASLDYILKIGSALVRQGGKIIAMKGKSVADELDIAKGEIKKNSLVLLHKDIVLLPFHSGERSILVFQKKCFT